MNENPYRVNVPLHAGSVFHSPEALGSVLRILLYALSGLGFIAFIMALLQALVFNHSQEFDPTVRWYFLVQRGNGVLRFLCFLACMTLSLVWIYRAHSNLSFLGAKTDYSPGWAVGWFFVPVANLFKPYNAMKQLWQASHSLSAWKETMIPALLPWWWALMLIQSLVGTFSMVARSMLNVWSPVELQAYAYGLVMIGFVVAPVSLATPLLFAQIIRRVGEAQLKRLDELMEDSHRV